MLNLITTRVFQPLAGIALLAMMFVMAGNAVLRVLTDSSPGWVVTFLTELAMPAVVFLGLLYTTLHHGHVRVDSLARRWSAKTQVRLRMLAWVLGAAFLLPIGVTNGLQALDHLGEKGGQSWTLPASVAYGMVSITTLLSALLLITFLFRPRENAQAEAHEDIAKL